MLDRRAIRLDPEVGTSEFEPPLEFRSRDRSASRTTAHIDPVVESPDRVVDTPLNGIDLKSRVKSLTHLRLPITIPVGKEHDVRSTGDNDPSARSDNPITWREVIGPHLCLIHHSISIRVDQQLDHSKLLFQCLLCNFSSLELPPDAPHRLIKFSGLVQLLRVDVPLDVISMELTHENPPMFIKGDPRRLLDDGLTRHQINLEAFGQYNPLSTLRRRKRLRRIFSPLDPGMR